MVTPAAPHRRLYVLLAVAAVCYAIGYPLALVGHSNVGWIFVGLGGPFLLAAGFVLIRRLYLSGEADRERGEPPG